MSPTFVKWMVGISSIVLVISIVVMSVFPKVYKKQLTNSITLSEGSLATQNWVDIPLPIHEKIYFFNITNGPAFLNNEEPLNVTEVGPYVYVGRWIKHNPQWNENGTVSYNETRTWHFVPELSAGSEDDVVHTLNGPIVMTAHKAKIGKVPQEVIPILLEDGKIIIEKSIRELTYAGYFDKIINLAPLIEKDLPFKNGMFMWLYDKNDTDDGMFTVFTGVNDQSRTNFINNWKGNENLNFWKNNSLCNKIEGTSMETSPPLPETPESYTFFQSIFCRSITYDYVGDTKSWGLTLKRFKPTSKVFANSTENPDNECYEINRERLSGVLDVGPCQFDSPVLLSFPHFHLGDPSLLRSIQGLNPKSDAHDSFLEVDPITGLTLTASIKFQMNLELELIPSIELFNNTQEGIYPVFWVDLSIELTEERANFLKSQLNTPKYIVYGMFCTLLFVSLVLIIFGAMRLKKSKQ